MCNDYEQHVRWAKYYSDADPELGIPTQQSELDLPVSLVFGARDSYAVCRNWNKLGMFGTPGAHSTTPL